MVLLFRGIQGIPLEKKQENHINYYRINKNPNSRNKNRASKIIKIVASSLLFFLNLALILKNFLLKFTITLVYRPARFLLRLFFYKVVVKFYTFYLSLIKKLGWKGIRSDFFSFVFNQKLVHVLVIFVSSFLIFINLTSKTKAGELDSTRKTILESFIQSEFGELQDDQVIIVETFDRDAIISDVHQSYLDSLGAINPDQKVATDAFEDGEDFLESDGANLVRPDLAETSISKKPRKEIESYVVQSGDSISTIAQEFGISVNTILWENDLSSYSIIRPGDTLDILPFSGLTYKVVSGDNLSSIAKKYDVEENVILEANRIASAERLQVGDKLLIPGGTKETYVPYTPKTYTGFTAIKDVVTAPSSQVVPANKMAWPTVGHTITQYYSWRHLGLDIANKTGTPLYAADAGTVEFVGVGVGYGNYVLIDHGGGKKTRYAHMSKFYVTNGQKVDKGEAIGEMGSTGWSTGPHIHFEVIINGTKYNPLNYIK